MTQLTLAEASHIDVLMRLVADFHHEAEITQEEDTRRGALLPLLEGSPHGAVYLAGPARAPIGYVIVCFGWSVEFGGMDGFVDELYIRPGVRGRGLGSEILLTLPKALAKAGLRALHLEVAGDSARARKLYERTGFATREGYLLMTRRF